MFVFERFLGRYRLEPVIGTCALIALVLGIAHFFIDLLLITSYRHAQSEFQHFYLCVHFACLVAALLILVYGFSALNANTYHSISNFRSWTLFVGLFLLFSGFFTTIGFSLDWPLFRGQCLGDFEDAHHDGQSGTSFEDQTDCRAIFRGLLGTHSVLWGSIESSLLILFLNVNSYKATRYADEIEQRQQIRYRALEERNRRPGIRKACGSAKEVDEKRLPDETAIMDLVEQLAMQAGQAVDPAGPTLPTPSKARLAKQDLEADPDIILSHTAPPCKPPRRYGSLLDVPKIVIESPTDEPTSGNPLLHLSTPTKEAYSAVKRTFTRQH